MATAADEATPIREGSMRFSADSPTPGGRTMTVAFRRVAATIVLLVVYLGRLVALDPNSNVIRVAALAAGIVLVPAFYLQVGRAFARPTATAP